MPLMVYRPIKKEPIDSRLGRFIPDDFDHVRKHPFTIRILVATSITVNKILILPYWHKSHDQGSDGSCVGHGVAIERAITNTAQNILEGIPGFKTRRYDPISIWNGAKEIDEWEDTNPGDSNGTSVNAAYKHIRDKGIIRVKHIALSGFTPIPIGSYNISKSDSILSYKWATSVDQIRMAIHSGLPVTIGVNWYRNFNNPSKKDGTNEYWIGVGDLGPIEGGHCVCIYGASDRRQAFRIKNSWGRNYPLVWIPYKVMGDLLDQDGEAALVVDR